jgi:hypothetical protein
VVTNISEEQVTSIFRVDHTAPQPRRSQSKNLTVLEDDEN